MNQNAWKLSSKETVKDRQPLAKRRDFRLILSSIKWTLVIMILSVKLETIFSI
jgi:hypothetical protein